MGALTYFNLTDFINHYGCETYVETGTGTGNCLRHALKFNFKANYSIDMDEGLITDAEREFKEDNVEFINKISTEALDELIPKLPKDKAILFWLDAHYPEADFRGLSHVESVEKYEKDVCFPLLKEIKVIKSYRDISKDCFILDDWINYHKKPILREFVDTHNCKAHLMQEGYLIAVPKKENFWPSHTYF